MTDMTSRNEPTYLGPSFLLTRAFAKMLSNWWAVEVEQGTGVPNLLIEGSPHCTAAHVAFKSASVLNVSTKQRVTGVDLPVWEALQRAAAPEDGVNLYFVHLRERKVYGGPLEAVAREEHSRWTGGGGDFPVGAIFFALADLPQAWTLDAVLAHAPTRDVLALHEHCMGVAQRVRYADEVPYLPTTVLLGRGLCIEARQTEEQLLPLSRGERADIGGPLPWRT